MKGDDWLPTHEDDLARLAMKWYEYATDAAQILIFGWPQDICTDLIDKIDAFFEARTHYEKVNSTANSAAKNKAKNEMKKTMREFANSFIRYNRQMSNANKESLGIYSPDRNHTPRPDPTDHVSFSLTVDVKSHILRVDYHIDGKTSRSKGHYHGVEVRFWVLPLDAVGPLTADELAWRSEVNTSSPWFHTFTGPELGQRLYVSMRWENGSVGKNPVTGRGPWSEIQNLVIS
jgi:hypothetical protein